MTEDVAKAFRQEKEGMYEDLKGIRMANREQHEALNNSLKENQKLNSTFKSSIKSMTHGIGALYFVILLMALVSIVTGPIGHVLVLIACTVPYIIRLHIRSLHGATYGISLISSLIYSLF